MILKAFCCSDILQNDIMKLYTSQVEETWKLEYKYWVTMVTGLGSTALKLNVKASLCLRQLTELKA